MALYAIGDLHLSFGTDKSMDVFGGRWENYTEKILEGFSMVGDEDTCVICGDLSWGTTLAQSQEDFLFIDRLPGKKIILKGNHDYWWTTARKTCGFFEENGITTISILNNNCYFYGETAICGTRGWFFEEEKGEAHDRKIMLREIIRLETSLKCAGDSPRLVFLHYPPKYRDYECPEILDLFEKYEVGVCFYGHIHSHGCAYAFTGMHRGTDYHLISADYMNFRPLKILD